MNKQHLGTSLEDVLNEFGILESATEYANKKIEEWKANTTKVYAVMLPDGSLVSKSVGNPIYVRQSDATKRLKRHKSGIVVVGEFVWKTLTQYEADKEQEANGKI